MAHEVGHLLDYEVLPAGEESEAEQRTTAEMRAVMQAIEQSPTYALVMKRGAEKPKPPREHWARAYAQYVA